MVKKSKIISTFIISLLVFPLLFSVHSVEVMGASGVAAKDKMPVLLNEVFGIDLSKYSIAEEGYGTRYEKGGLIEVDGYSCTLVDKNGGLVDVHGTFHNGFPDWIYISPRSDGTLYYVIDPPNGSVEAWKNLFERYTIFAQKYEIPTVDKSLALELFSKAPNNLPTSQTSDVKVVLDDASLYISQEGFSFVSIVDGVEIPNKSFGLTFTDNQIVFGDKFGFYDVKSVNIFSEEEFTNFAFDLAKKFCDSLFSSSEGDVVPDWTNMQSDISLKMIAGQQFNNALNDALLAQGVGINTGSTVREASTLYPFWSAIFYFSRPVDNVVGVQVGVWGDTGEVAYCYEYGHLGGFYDSSTVDVPSSESLNDDSTSLNSVNDDDGDGYLLLGGIVVIMLMVIVGIFVFNKKKHK